MWDLLDTPGRGRVAAAGDVDGLARALEAELAAAPPEPSALIAAVQAYRITPVVNAYLDVFEASRTRRQPPIS